MTELLLTALWRQAALFSLAVLLLAALRPLLRRLGAGALYAGWLLLPAVLLTPALPRPATEPLRVVLAAAGTTVQTAAPVLPMPTASKAALWLALWLAGAAAVLLVQTRRQRRLSRLGTRLPAGSSPALVGLLRPRVALPSDFEQRFTPPQRALILAHENVHRVRLDNLWNLLACGLTALHWWNPLAWWAAQRFRADQELACDAAVLAAHPSSRTDYAQALLAAHDLHHLGAPLASRWGTSHPLVERIAMLKAARPMSRTGTSALGAVLLAAAGLAYATQAEAPATEARKVELKMDISYRSGHSGASQTLTSKPTVRIPLGGRATVMLSGAPDKPSPEQLAITISAQDLGDDRIELRTEVSKGDPLTVVSRPRLITRNGVKALIEQGRDDPVASEHLSLAITPTLLAATSP